MVYTPKDGGVVPMMVEELARKWLGSGPPEELA